MTEQETDLAGEALSAQTRLVFVIEADDPRFTPTRSIEVTTSAEGWSLGDLETVTDRLRDECLWGLGAIEDYRKSQGGVGASGLEALSVTLGVINTVPTVALLLELLNRRMPPRPSREEALEAATWAVATRYAKVVRGELVVTQETQYPDHWLIAFRWPRTGDEFEVGVYGARSGVTSVQTVTWINGDPYAKGEE
ncbi:hypothetical protein [Serinicoccus kebangsaanensis]|uniref:hypothetical protein n=1 Tax=Serinicoccus kebangsaanensis TaxID=2602069 RepID=UPI00124C58B8|nr:hypothetical protein [Serinicoccus kebangsaanensis]